MKTYGSLRLELKNPHKVAAPPLLAHLPSREPKVWVLDGLEPHVIQRLKALFPRIPKEGSPPFAFPDTPQTAADLEWFMARYPLLMTRGEARRLQEARDTFDRNQELLESVMVPDFVSPAYAGLREGWEIRNYQAQPVEMLSLSGGVICGDEVGLGKTFVGIGACLSPGALPAIIVCQPHLQKQWVERIRAATTLRVHAIKRTKPYTLPPTDVYVFRYTQLLGWIDYASKLGHRLIAYDEIQELRTGIGPDSAPVLKGRAAARFSAFAERRLGLTATPIYGYGAEIWDVMSFVNDSVLGPKEDFLREWCSGKVVKDSPALGAFLRDQHAFIRRTKKDVGKEVPPVNKIVKVIDFDADTMRSAEAMAHKLAIAATTGTFTERGNAARQLDLKLRQQTGIAKARGVASLARIIIEGGTPIILAGWHREVYAIWLKALEDLNPVMYTGSETPSQKARAKDDFIGGRSPCMIISLRSGAGLDGLQQRCSTVLVGELDWSPGVHHQLIGRVDRDGQESYPVTAIFAVVEEGSDPPMMEMNGIKADQAHGINDPTLGAQAVHSDESRLHALVQRYLHKGR